jgi:hypothetical protein
VVIVTVPFIFPLHMEPMDYFRGTPYAIERLAAKHGFVIAELVKLGNVRDVLATVLEDVSVLPTKSTFPSRLAARVLRASRKVLVSVLETDLLWTLVQVNANTYLSNAVILRPNSETSIN